MKKRILALFMATIMMLSLVVVAHADTFTDSTIDPTRKGSIELWKYDITKANEGLSAEDKAALESYVSSGVKDADLEAKLANYAIEGVEYTYLKVADVVSYSETETDGTHKNMVLYGIDDTVGADLLTALGLTTADAYAVHAGSAAPDFVPAANTHYFMSDTLVNALKAGLQANSTTVKNALEAYVAAQHGTAMALTDANGHAKADNLNQGLYLIIETKVPENVTSTTNPFFVSIPTTAVNGDPNRTDGGNRWIYDVVIYPKNETGDPDVEKTVREAKTDTGVNNGSAATDDGYGNTANASAGDKVEYQIISHLPVITSDASQLTVYTFVDTLSKGIEFNGNETANTAGLLNGHFNANDVVIAFYTDAACTAANKVVEWHEDDMNNATPPAADPRFTVAYAAADGDATTMTITMTQRGLNEINKNGTYTGRPALEQGYSQLWMRITYSATLNQNADLVLGDLGNPNDVTLTWKRTSTSYSDTLTDSDTTVYAYAIDLTKEFSDGATDKFGDVKFKLHNETDGYYVVAEESAAGSGIWYVKGHDEAEANGTVMTPSTANGKLVIYGLEADTYKLVELETASGYTLLKEPIIFVITSTESVDNEKVDNQDGKTYTTGSTTIDGDAVAMEDQGNSHNAMAPLTVINQKGFELPRTGGDGTMQFAIFGLIGLAGVAAIIFLVAKKGKKEEENA